ncbi:MAG: histidine kinase dimerization/phospho-acceptor domain-containing protein, partial [Bacteroidota bacterium]|nr:histidine kinase dimerization/phospho-acceptor domain-containing protein [Bacteroidota bacterium]
MQKLVLCLSNSDFCNRIKEMNYRVFTTMQEIDNEKPEIIFCDNRQYIKNKTLLSEILNTTPGIIINEDKEKPFNIFISQISHKAYILTIKNTIRWTCEKFSLLKKIKELSQTDPNSFANIMSKMSHRIRTPLNGIIGMTELIAESELSGSQEAYIETIKESSQELMKLMNDILEYSNLIEKNVKVRNNSFNLFNCIEESIDTAIGDIFDKQINLSYFLSPNLPYYIFSDEDKIKNALNIIITYLIKNSKRGDLTLKIIPDETGHIQYSNTHNNNYNGDSLP